MAAINFDITPNDAGLVICAPTHKACAALSERGLEGAVTIKSLLFKPAFTPELEAVMTAVRNCDPAAWPKHPKLAAAPSRHTLGLAQQVFIKHGEEDVLKFLQVNGLDFIDLTQGTAGWVPREDVRYACVVVDEAGMSMRAEIEELRKRCDLVILAGDARGQLQPVVSSLMAEELSSPDARSAMSDLALEDFGCEVLDLTQNMRSQNAISQIKDLCFAKPPIPLDQVVQTLRDINDGSFVFAQKPDISLINQGVPVITTMNLTRLKFNLAIRRARGWLNDGHHIGQVILVGSVQNKTLLANAPATLQKNTRWMITHVHDDGRVDLENLTKRTDRISRVSVYLSEFDTGEACQKWSAENEGKKYPEFGPRFADIRGKLGEVVTTHSMQGDSVDQVIVNLPDFRRYAAWGLRDRITGEATWKAALNVAVSRARHRVHFITQNPADSTKRVGG